ncbi:MAG: CHY zinc finger protein [Pyrinomonadaceae bacterium]
MTDHSNDALVHGIDVDAETRCAHWDSPLDIVAIKFKCCDKWYACYECHREIATHDSIVWPRDKFEERATLCGACKSRLTIGEYLASYSRCPSCGAGFNPGCANHYDLYFDV